VSHLRLQSGTLRLHLGEPGSCGGQFDILLPELPFQFR
jgi:hypothetical protein